MQKFLVVITGPTGIGKTSVSIDVARYFQSEIISSDSRQIFRELSIGTAVPDAEERKAVPHHFVHSHSLEEDYNASRFEKDVLELLEKLYMKHNMVLLVGGSMLYVDAVCKGIDLMPDADPEIRQKLKQQFENEGIESLRLQLKKLDPDYYKTVDLKNPNRIIHALEISIQTGKPYSSFRTETTKERHFKIIKIGLNCDRNELHNRINQRVDKMIESGLLEEARSVYDKKHLNSLNTVGYRELFSHFDGEISKEDAFGLIKRNSRRYARKQITWFRRDPEMQWFEPDETVKIIEYISEKIKKE